jgi:hypothetical protein
MKGARIVLSLAVIAVPSVKGRGASPSLLYGVRAEEVWIPMKDGTRLAACLHIPTGGKPDEKFPALLEYLPYRKDDGLLEQYPNHSYFAHRGYVSAQVDIRGTGRSEGHTPDREYSEQELADGMEVIAWLARQPWSNGNVGMFGISWGGFNSLQLAMRRPPALKAILAACATEKLYNEDIHFLDGMLHVDEYEPEIDLKTAMTRAPDFPLDEKTLEARFDNPPWFILYKRHQHDGEFWREPVSSLDAIQIPVFLIGGFIDGYRDSIPRMLAHLKTPVKAIIGPWNHTFPDDANPGPQIEWRDEAIRWWDHWLKGKQNGAMDGPRVAVYMRHWYPPGLDLTEIPGEWLSEETWPPGDLHEETLCLNSDHSLALSGSPTDVHSLKYIPSAGLINSALWWGDLSIDQRPADAFSLVYDSAPLNEDTAILGTPQAFLEVSATAPLAHWFVRLSDVAPDGPVNLVTGGGMNGAQRESMSEPEDLEPGRAYSLRIPLHFTSWVFPRGHRMRLAVSNALFPIIWPTPYAMTTSLHLGGQRPSHLVLPVVPLENHLPRPHFLPPTPSDPLPGAYSIRNDLLPGEFIIERNEVRQVTRMEQNYYSATEFPWGQEKHHAKWTFDVQDTHPDVSSVRVETDTFVDLRDRALTWRGILDFRSDKTHFFYRYERELLRNGQLVREKKWEETLDRDHQ